MSEHTKEPWAVADWSNDDGDDLTTIESSEPEILSPGQSNIWPNGIRKINVASTAEGNNPIADARRIVACVNACAGIPTGMLIAAGQSAVMALRPIDEVVAERNELLAACKTFVEWLDREDAGFVKAGNKRETPEDEKRWREWFDGNIALCSLAQEQARAAIANTKEKS